MLHKANANFGNEIWDSCLGMAIIGSIPLSARTRACALKRTLHHGDIWRLSLGNSEEFEIGRIIWEEALAKLAITFTNAIHSKSKDQSTVPIAKTT